MQKTKNNQDNTKEGEQSEKTHISYLADSTSYINFLAVSHNRL